jgi:hypothetical protein
MQRRDRLLLDALDGNRTNLLIPIRFEQCLGVGAVRLVATHVPVNVVRGQEANGMAKRLQLPRPVMRRPTGFEDDGRRLLLRKVRQKPATRESPLFVDVSRST